MLFSDGSVISYSLGLHRITKPKDSTPQSAWKIDNTPVARPTETLVNVHTLHIDSASFEQIAGVCGRDTERMSKHILDIVAQRGKMHNPVTGSGGVLVGTVEQLDGVFAKKSGLAIGDTVVSLTSLSWLTINVVNVPNTEFATILLTKADGRILFFSMATSFTTAALGAEGMARQVEMHIGNGYMPDCGAFALQLLRDYPTLRAIFARRFG